MLSNNERGELRCPYRRQNTGTPRCQNLRMVPWWYWFLGVPISFAVVAGNGFVAFLIITKRQLHNPANWIVLSLAVADLITGAGSVLIDYLHYAHLLSYETQYGLFSFLAASSTLNLCLLLLDRYIYFTRPLQYAVLATTRRCLVAIFGVWATAFTSHCLFFVICIKMPPSVDQKCMEDFATFDFVIFETLPMIVLAFAFGTIFSITRKISREVAVQLRQLRFNYDNVAVETARPSESKDKKTTGKIFGIAVAAFAVCYLNEVIYTVLYEIDGRSPSKDFSLVVTILYLVNSAVNPVAYSLYKSDINKAIRRMLCRGRVDRPIATANASTVGGNVNSARSLPEVAGDNHAGLKSNRWNHEALKSDVNRNLCDGLLSLITTLYIRFFKSPRCSTNYN